MIVKYLYSKIIALIFIVLAFSVNNIYGQLTVKPTNHSQIIFSKKGIPVQNDTINLPFWDDFSASSQLADSALWLYADQVFINNGFAYLPPSKNVATLDAFNATGQSYGTKSNEIGIGDSLVSKPIDLSSFTNANNISLSYFWQEGFGPNAPDSEDSLRLYFKANNQEWILMHSFGGTGSALPAKFQQKFESVNTNRFLHQGFQFKFEYYGNLAGDFDIWNLDYIYLNQGNTSVSTLDFRYDSYEDRTFSSIKKGVFGDYFGIPLKHVTIAFLQNIMDTSVVIYNNLWAGNGNSTIFGTEIFGTIRDTLNPNILIDSVAVNGNFLTQAQDTALFTAQTKNISNVANYLIAAASTMDSAYLALNFNLGNTDSLFFETINGSINYYPRYSFRVNDTITQITSFHDYYALDDGTAEASLQLNSKNYELSQQFQVNGTNILTAIDIYVPNIAQNASNQNITLIVRSGLSSENPTEQVLAAQNVLIQPSNGINTFQRFQLETPVSVEGNIFVGYREENDEVVSIGFDKNSNSAANLYYNQSGTWQKNTDIEGSIMLRPVFGKLTDVLANKEEIDILPLKAFPNPNRGLLQLNQPYKQLIIYNSQGQIVFTKTSAFDAAQQEELDIAHLNNGLYIIQIKTNEGMKNTRLLINK